MQPKCVLVVDDDFDVRDAVAEVLRQAGYEAREAVNGRDALAQLEAMGREPCLVLLDMLMPEMTGAQLIAVMQETHRLAMLPVVLFSADAQHGHGARRLLRKPVSLELLLQVVEEFCGEP
jgi:CheY-like chemotaxis protein